jgi:Virulence-associated protein E/VirE N-terminal domain/Domain of unknonw function from B. Theta Gene description (DUF3874)
MKVTLLNGALTSHQPATLERIVGLLQDEKQRKRIEDFRSILPYCSPDSLPVGLDKIPVVVFSSWYAKGEWKGYTGLVTIEFEKLSGYAEARRVCQEVVCFNRPFMAFVGSGGQSVKVVVRYILPDGSLPVTEEEAALFHAHAYRRAVLHYQAQFQWKVKDKEPRLKQGCRLSFDPDCYYNPDSLPIRMEQPERMPEEPGFVDRIRRSEDPLVRILPGTAQRKKIEILFETCLQKVRQEQGMQWEEEEPKLFFTTVAGYCFDSAIPEEDVVKWLTFLSGGKENEVLVRMTVRNVYASRKPFGKKPCIPAPMNLLARMEEFLKRRYELRRNEIRDEVEYRERHSFCYHFRPVTLEVLNGICLNAMEEGLEIWDKDVRRYIYSPRVPTYNPLETFFADLPQWDGTDRIRALADRVPTDNLLWRDHFYCWFLSMVAHWRKQDRMYANSLVPVLVGKQGISKSVFFRSILPPALRDYQAESINLENKSEAELLMARNLLITIDEFDRLNKKYQADLKHLIQKPEVKVRVPHQKTFRQMKRLASFSATANPMDLLTDPTGSRRYLCVEVTGPIDMSSPICYEQLYAQARHAISSSERYWLNQEEEAELTVTNADFRQQSLEMQYLFSYFRLPAKGETGEKYTAVQLLDIISTRSKRKFSNTSSLTFGRMLNASGISKIHTVRGNVYELIPL